VGGKKAEQHVVAEYLDAVLAEFSGYIAADELYDGCFCVLSIVDNRTFRRITYEVLDHDPTQADVESLFRTFEAALQQRGLTLRGITTDGSSLYPEPISRVFGEVPHQLCEFHVIKELTKGVLRALARVRKELAATKPKLGRGRPSSVTARKAARRRKWIEQKVGDLFQHRYLFVQHSLTPVQQRTLIRSPVDGPNCERCETSWTRCIGCLTAVVARKPRWPNWRGCGVASDASSGLAKPCKSCSLRIWKKR
jgi:hypothetical protein